jgi:hypothetical protein
MNWSEIKTNWDEMRPLLQGHWPKLTDEVLDGIDRDRYELGRALQRHYGLSAGDAESAICEFEKDVRRPGAVK